jgi:hypothetical protein
VARVKEHLLGFHQTILEYSEDDLAGLSMPEMYQLFLVLDDIAHLEVGDRLAGEVLCDGQVQAALPVVRDYYLRFFDLHETALARAILVSSDPWTVLRRYALFPRYEALIQTQVDMLADRRVKRMAFIGSGPVPVTAILLEQNHGVAAVCLDEDPEAVDVSQRVLERLGLKNVMVRQGDETGANPQECDAVLVAALAEPKERILKVLSDNLNGCGAPVLLRTYSGLRTVLHEPFDPAHADGFLERARVHPTGRVNNTLIRLESA